MKKIISWILGALIVAGIVYAAQTDVETPGDSFGVAWERQHAMNTEIYSDIAGKEGTLTNSAGLATALSDETGDGGGFVRANNATLVTPALGTPSAAVLTNASGTASSLTVGLFSCVDNEDTDEDNTIVFVDGATGGQGAETDGDFHYNPSSGTVTATKFAGALNGTVGATTPAAGSFTTLACTDLDPTGDVDTTGANSFLTGPIAFEGATADAYELTLAVVDPTADRTVTFRDDTGTVIISGDTFTGDVTATLDTDGSTALTIETNAVDTEHLADDAVGTAELANDLNLVTTGTVSAAIPIITTTDGSESPTAQQQYGTMFIADHATAANDTTYTLNATLAAGMCNCYYDNGGGTGGVIVDPPTGDYIILDGVELASGEAINSPGVAGDGANGDFICIMAISATHWITLGKSGTWVEATP